MGRALPKFGRYSTLGVLGQGGMGTVYRATHPDYEYEIAIKALSTGVANLVRHERFRREIRAMAQLRHPGLVEIVDTGGEGEVPWFAMRLVEGESLQERLRFGPLTAEETLELGIQLCDALAVAHSQGILHRDLKPANILCAEDGRYVVTDFGLAKDTLHDPTLPLSATGVLQGTPGYWAPEQASGEGKEATEQTDVYGVGSVLYAALTGFAPYRGSSLEEVLGKTLTQKPQTLSELVEVPPALDALVMRCLAREPGDRHSSLEALGRRLRRAKGGDVVVPGQGPSARLLLGFVAVALVCVTLAVAVRTGSSEPELAERERERTPPPAVEVDDEPAPPALPAWFTDLKRRDRPPLPLPEGLSFSETPGDYVHARDGSVLRWVRPGIYRMGSDSSQELNQGPEHDVHFERGFYLGKHEASWAQYRAFCAASGTEVPSNVFAPGREAGDDHPVFNVSWDEAQAYCSWAGLRLPSEAEWEYAARGRKSTTYPWGNGSPREGLLNMADQSADWEWPREEETLFMLAKADWEDGYAYTAPVDAFPEGASSFGCLNMAGNVIEWLADGYQATYQDTPRDGSAAGLDPSGLRSNRGGCWSSDARLCRSVNRGRDLPDKRYPYLGFRVARSP